MLEGGIKKKTKFEIKNIPSNMRIKVKEGLALYYSLLQ